MLWLNPCRASDSRVMAAEYLAATIRVKDCSPRHEAGIEGACGGVNDQIGAESIGNFPV
jgi:hypothetical protein